MNDPRGTDAYVVYLNQRELFALLKLLDDQVEHEESTLGDVQRRAREANDRGLVKSKLPPPPKAGDPVPEDTLVLALCNLVAAWGAPPQEGKGANIVAAARDVARAFEGNCLTLADGTCGSTRLCMHSRNSVQHSEWPSFTPHPQDPKRCYICGETEDFHGTAQNHCHPFVIKT